MVMWLYVLAIVYITHSIMIINGRFEDDKDGNCEQQTMEDDKIYDLEKKLDALMILFWNKERIISLYKNDEIAVKRSHVLLPEELRYKLNHCA